MTQPPNTEVAAVFQRIGDLMDYQEANPFKVRSYWRAAKVLAEWPEPLADVAARGALGSLPGVGEAITGKIGEILETGTCRLYERLKGEVPEGIQRLLCLPGMSPRLARLLRDARGVTTPEALQAAVAEGLEDVPGLKPADRQRILQAAESREAGPQ